MRLNFRSPCQRTLLPFGKAAANSTYSTRLVLHLHLRHPVTCPSSPRWNALSRRIVSREVV